MKEQIKRAYELLDNEDNKLTLSIAKELKGKKVQIAWDGWGDNAPQLNEFVIEDIINEGDRKQMAIDAGLEDYPACGMNEYRRMHDETTILTPDLKSVCFCFDLSDGKDVFAMHDGGFVYYEVVE